MKNETFYTEQNDRIVHANTAFQETIASGAINDAEVLDVALRLITAEQDTAISELNQRYDADIKAAETLPEVALNRIGEIANLLAGYENADIEKQRQLALLAMYYAEARGISLTDHGSAIEALQQERSILESQKEVDLEANPHLQIPWQIPKRTASVDERDFRIDFPTYLDWSLGDTEDNNSETIDVFPDDQALQHHAGQQARERYKGDHLNGASELVGAFLAMEPGLPWTSGDIGEQLYNDGNYNTTKATRASALLSNLRHGKTTVIADTLRDLSRGELVVQFGRRYTVRGGKYIGRGTRLVRSVDPSKIHELTEYPSDIWEKLPTDAELLAPEVGSSTPEQTPPSVGEVPSFATATVEEPSSDHEVEGPEWHDKFRNAVSIEIGKLIDAGLDITQEEILYTVLRGLGSRTLGTKENFERGIQRSVIKAAPGKGDSLPLEAVIALAMLNGQRDIFNNKKRAAEAMQIIAEEVAEQRKQDSVASSQLHNV